MKEIKWSLLLFISLALFLAFIIPNLGLQHLTTGDQDVIVQRMAVALVNEDHGVEFEGRHLSFGEEFVSSIERDDTHEWYVVSRGVAESGMRRDIYNLMIVIPSHFSERAVSLTSANPERVTLTYQINYTGNSDLLVEAERATAAILEDINRRIIDVYFVSILMNLQQAQDNIATLVDVNNNYILRFQNDINAPLSSYTMMFQNIENYTDRSREGFQGFQDLLQSQNESFFEAGLENESHRMGWDTFMAQRELINAFNQAFSDQFRGLDQALMNTNILEELDFLREFNALIAAEFHNIENESNLLSKVEEIKSSTMDTKQMMSDFYDELNAILDFVLEDSLSDELRSILTATDRDIYYLSDLVEGINERFQSKIEETIFDLVIFDQDLFEAFGLTSSERYQRLVTLSRIHAEDLELDPDWPEAQFVMADIISHLRSDGVQLEANVTVPTSPLPSTITLFIREDFEFQSGSLVITNGQIINSSIDYDGNQLTFSLPAGVAQNLTFTVTGVLDQNLTESDLLGSVTWGGILQQQDQLQVFVPGPGCPLVGSNPTPTCPSGQTLIGICPFDGMWIDPSGVCFDGSLPALFCSGGGTLNCPTCPLIPQNIAVNRPGQAIFPTTIPPLLANTENILQEIYSIIQIYERLDILYRLYYGIDVETLDVDWDEIEEKISSLGELADEDFYYYLFNHREILDWVINFITDPFTEAYANQLQNLLEQMLIHIEKIEVIDEQSQNILDQLLDLRQKTESNNVDLLVILDEIVGWRQSSQILAEHNEVVLQNMGEEQNFIVDLDNSFMDLWLRSQQLLETTDGNLESAIFIHELFDALNAEAMNLQESGQTIVGDAEVLAARLIERMDEDQTFSENFSQVMGHSRIGGRQNENLFSFLSRPVDRENMGVMVSGDRTTPYYLVLTFTLVSLFTSYAISNYEKNRRQKDQFSEELSLPLKNLPISILVVTVAIIEGAVIGLAINYLFPEGLGLLWIFLCMLITLTLVSVCTYGLRQLKMVGMFILLVLMSFYLFLTEAVGARVAGGSIFARLRGYSPLQYLEQHLSQILQTGTISSIFIYSLIGISVLFITLNLFVWRWEKPSGDVLTEAKPKKAFLAIFIILIIFSLGRSQNVRANGDLRYDGRIQIQVERLQETEAQRERRREEVPETLLYQMGIPLFTEETEAILLFKRQEQEERLRQLENRLFTLDLEPGQTIENIQSSLFQEDIIHDQTTAEEIDEALQMNVALMVLIGGVVILLTGTVYYTSRNSWE